jgi:hypothetical protein
MRRFVHHSPLGLLVMRLLDLIEALRGVGIMVHVRVVPED